jgi:hypothetical protein
MRACLKLRGVIPNYRRMCAHVGYGTPFFFFFLDMSYRIYEVKRGVWVCDKGIKEPDVNT